MLKRFMTIATILMAVLSEAARRLARSSNVPGPGGVSNIASDTVAERAPFSLPD
jgi:hypothetical protein